MILTIVPGCCRVDHVPHGRLHGEERRPQIDGDVLLEQFGARVEQSPARRQTRRVDEAVHPAEAFHRPLHRPGGLTGLGEIGTDERDRRVVGLQVIDEGLTGLGPAAREGHLRAFANRRPDDPGPDSLGATTDEDDLLRQKRHAAIPFLAAQCPWSSWVSSVSSSPPAIWRVSSSRPTSERFLSRTAWPSFRMMKWLPTR